MPFDPTEFVKPSPPRAKSVEPGFERLVPLVSAQELRRQFLFGMKLESTITHEKLEDLDIQAIITRAVSRVEHEAKIQISPVKFTEYHDYNLFDYQKWDFIQLNKWPIQQVESFRAQYPYTDQFIDFPTNWITTYNETGIIQLVPKNGSFSQFLITRDASLLPLILGGRARWPQLWAITYVAGFELDKMPAIINELVGNYAAIDILQMMDSITFLGSYSVGIDGVSQSLGLPSPGYLQNRIGIMNEKAASLLTSVKDFYNHKLLMSSL